VAGWPLYQILVILGGSATVAWLVDGSSRRYMGPGLLALATGGGISLYNALDTEAMKGEHGIVYPLIGIGLLVASLFNPLALRGAGTFLLIVGAVALTSSPWDPGWTLVAILAVWSVVNFARIARDGVGADPDSATEVAPDRSARSAVRAGH